MTYIFITTNKMAQTKKYDQHKMQKASHRKALIEAGFYGRFKEKSVPSGKQFKRHEKHRGANLRGLN